MTSVLIMIKIELYVISDSYQAMYNWVFYVRYNIYIQCQIQTFDRYDIEVSTTLVVSFFTFQTIRYHGKKYNIIIYNISNLENYDHFFNFKNIGLSQKVQN